MLRTTEVEMLRIPDVSVEGHGSRCGCCDQRSLALRGLGASENGCCLFMASENGCSLFMAPLHDMACW